MFISYLNDVVDWSKNCVYSSINISETFQLDAQILTTIDVKTAVHICMLNLTRCQVEMMFESFVLLSMYES
jgi:hypothetical protein